MFKVYCVFFPCFRKWKLHRKPAALNAEALPLPAVSILKPLTGVDPHLYENLETFFTMDYHQVCHQYWIVVQCTSFKMMSAYDFTLARLQMK